MDVHDEIQTFVYDGDFSLPSMSPECTQTLLYIAITKVPVHLRILNSIKYCFFYGAPTVVHRNISYRTFEDIVRYLKTLNYNPDNALTAKQSSEALALKHYVRSKMRPVLEFVMWLDERNCNELTSKWFMKALPFPCNYVITRNLRENAVTYIQTLFAENVPKEKIKECIVNMCTECMTSLSTRLGNTEFFYGNVPTTLDVIVYSYFAPLLKLPLPSNDICNLVRTLPNIVNFVKRMDANYFPNVKHESKYLPVENKMSDNSDEDISYVAVCIIGVSMLSLMFGFVFSKGIVNLRGA